MNKQWKRYHVVVKNPETKEEVLNRWFVRFENMKEELKELSNRHGWSGYHIDIREYRHNPEWVWRSKL